MTLESATATDVRKQTTGGGTRPLPPADLKLRVARRSLRTATQIPRRRGTARAAPASIVGKGIEALDLHRLTRRRRRRHFEKRGDQTGGILVLEKLGRIDELRLARLLVAREAFVKLAPRTLLQRLPDLVGLWNRLPGDFDARGLEQPFHATRLGPRHQQDAAPRLAGASRATAAMHVGIGGTRRIDMNHR